jgi:hypothetical protein
MLGTVCVRQRLTVRDELFGHHLATPAISVDGKPITILDVSGIPSEVRNVVVSVLWSHLRLCDVERNAYAGPIVCEEAHATRRATPGSACAAKRALSRSSGKAEYGVSLCVVTQRPSDRRRACCRNATRSSHCG